MANKTKRYKIGFSTNRTRPRKPMAEKTSDEISNELADDLSNSYKAGTYATIIKAIEANARRDIDRCIRMAESQARNGRYTTAARHYSLAAAYSDVLAMIKCTTREVEIRDDIRPFLFNNDE